MTLSEQKFREVVRADREFFVVRRSRSGPVDVGKATPILFVPLPDLRRCVRAVFCHSFSFFWNGFPEHA